MGDPQNGWFIMNHPIKMHDLRVHVPFKVAIGWLYLVGVPLFKHTQGLQRCVANKSFCVASLIAQPDRRRCEG